MLIVKILFILSYIVESISVIIGLRYLSKLNNGKVEDSTIINAIMLNIVGIIIYFMSIKIYLFLGITLASVFVMIFLLADLNEDIVEKISFKQKMYLTFNTMFFWPQVICANYFILKIK